MIIEIDQSDAWKVYDADVKPAAIYQTDGEDVGAGE